MPAFLFATAREFGYTLVRDARMLEYGGQGHVKVKENLEAGRYSPKAIWPYSWLTGKAF